MKPPGTAGGGSPLICPDCGRRLPALPRVCPGCGLRFRWIPMAALLSAALPGAGHFYLGRRFLACIEAAGGLAIFLTALYRLGEVFLRVVGEAGNPLDLLAPCLRWSVLLAGYSVADACFTLLVSRRRLVPERADPAPERDAGADPPDQTRK